MTILKENEVIEDLQLNGLKIIQDHSGYCFTSDAVVLANFVSCKHTDECVEFGSGSGVISILVNAKNKPKHITMFEIQPKLAEMSKRSIELNNLQNEIDIEICDLKDAKNHVQNIDLVYMNPPYFKNCSKMVSPCMEQQICKHELETSLEKICKSANQILKDGGKFYIVFLAERTAELISTLINSRLEPKRMFFAAPSNEAEARIVLVEAVKNGKSGIKILPTLITNDTNGDYIATLHTLYKRRF